jgi:hypothetical protein
MRTWFCDGQAYSLFAREDARQDALLQGLCPVSHDGRASDGKSPEQIPDKATASWARELITDNQLVE